MANNKRAKRDILEAWNALMDVRDDTPGLSKKQKDRIKASIKALKVEYLALSRDRIDPKADYAEITQKLSASKTKLEKIKKDREKLKNQIVTADKILSTVTAVLALIA